MKFSYLILALIFAVSCQTDAEKESKEPAQHQEDIDEAHGDEQFHQGTSDMSDADAEVAVTANGLLECKFLGESEFGAPQNSVLVGFNGSKIAVGKCDGCQKINKKAFSDYEIPSNAISACGGWWAGAGDYFYTVKNKNGGIDVFVGWQDEGQLENDDTSYHWKRTKTLK